MAIADVYRIYFLFNWNYHDRVVKVGPVERDYSCKQIVIAMGEGAKASLSAFDYLIRESVAA